jgi:hypothetical protein
VPEGWTLRMRFENIKAPAPVPTFDIKSYRGGGKKLHSGPGFRFELKN